MRTHAILPIVALAMICNSICPGASEPKRTNDSILRQTFDLGAQRTPQPQSFEMESQMITYALDGKRISTDIFRLQLKCAPARVTRQERR